MLFIEVAIFINKNFVAETSLFSENDKSAPIAEEPVMDKIPESKIGSVPNAPFSV